MDNFEETTSITPFPNAPVLADAPLMEQLEQYWTKLRGSNRLPARSDVDPAAIDAILPHCFLLQRVAPGIARMRVAGQSLSSLIGMDATGMPLSTFFTPKDRDAIAPLLESVFAEPAIIELAIGSARSMGRPRLTGKLMILPLAGADGFVNRAIGAIMLDGRLGRTPRRLFLDDAPVLRQECVDMIPNHPHLAVAAEAATPFLHKEKGPAQTRPALYVVKD